MVDHATLIAALWDGSSGGTASCVRYFEEVGKPCVNLWPRWQAFTEARSPELRLRPTVIGGGKIKSDYIVIHEGRRIDRIREGTDRFGHNPGRDWTINRRSQPRHGRAVRRVH
jgi:hypothetical protein